MSDWRQLLAETENTQSHPFNPLNPTLSSQTENLKDKKDDFVGFENQMTDSKPDMAASTVQDSGPPQVPNPPIQPGWLVTYRESDGRLQGGDLDRQHGTVASAEYGSRGWVLTLTDGSSVAFAEIQGVTKTAQDGSVLAAWTVRAHGHDGESR
jgi:hypothetical protein